MSLSNDQRLAISAVVHQNYYMPDVFAAVEAIVSEALAARETELREQIAGEIEGLAEWDGAGWPNHAYEIKAAAADIARGDDR